MPDPQYQTFSYKAVNAKGLVARYVNDAMPPGSFVNLDNLESRAENSIASRLGMSALSTDGTDNFALSDAPYSLARMKGLDQGFRYAAANGTLFRLAGDNPGRFLPITGGLAVASGTLAVFGTDFLATVLFVDTSLLVDIGSNITVAGFSLESMNGTHTVVNSGPGFITWVQTASNPGTSTGGLVYLATQVPVLSGQRLSMFPYRPDGNSSPYMFFADKTRLLKDNGVFPAAQDWGSDAPIVPPIPIIATPSALFIDSFDFGSNIVFVNYTGTSIAARIQGTINPVPNVGLNFVTEKQPTIAVGGLIRAANVTTVTTVANHGYVSGMKVAIVNSINNSFNVASAVITVTGVKTFTYSNPGANITSGDLTTTISFLPSLSPGMFLLIGGVFWTLIANVTDKGFTTYINTAQPAGAVVTDSFQKGNIAANTLATLTRAVAVNLNTFNPSFPNSTAVPQDTDLISFFIQVSDPMAINEIKLSFDVGDGTFTHDYYWKSVTPATWQPAVSGTVHSGDAFSKRISDRALSRADNRRLGYIANDLVPTDLEDLRWLRPKELNTGKAAWTLIQVARKEFAKVGAAGTMTNDWSKVVGYQISIKTAPNAGATVGVDDLALIGGSGLDSFAGQPYDWRYTYYNINTGYETNGSPALMSQYFVSPRRQPVQIPLVQPGDSQITHFRIYRRGGTLAQAWYRVAQIPIGATSYTDTTDDATIELGGQLELDNDPPVTSIMRAPLELPITNIQPFNSLGGELMTVTLSSTSKMAVGQLITVGSGATTEQAIVSKITGPTIFQVFLQNAHKIGETVAASTTPRRAMNLMANAFDKMWLAGDPDNPHVLYYSKTFRPESFPSQNFIEIGTPDAPIMAIVELLGQLFVFTTKTVYRVMGAGSNIPITIPTGVKHGLAASFGWACGEYVIYYLSYDGVYVFQGAASIYITEQTEWIWTGKTSVPGGDATLVPAMDPTQRDQTFMTYGNHEVWVSYIDVNGSRRRMVFHDTYQRWRNDSTASGGITAMFFEQDLAKLVVAKDDGMIYLDRAGDYDSGGFAAGVEVQNPITFLMQSAQMDQEVKKRPKVYNELTLEMDTQDQNVNVYLIFDSGLTEQFIGTFKAAGRQQVQINVNNGLGRKSPDIGIRLAGSVTKAVTLFEVHIRAAVEAESRQSWDTYKMQFGDAGFKVIKQAWMVYSSTSNITVQVFVEDDAMPRFSFTLPASNKRTATRVRFPATKFKGIRFIGTSVNDFQMYPESEFEWKPACSGKGYAKQPANVV